MRSLNILIAEDDDQNQAMLKLILSRRGHQVKSAWNGLQAIEAVKAENFDVVLMDVQMPEMDGLEATRQIRLWENNQRHVPIVILTGSVPAKTSDIYKTAGADTFLSKPFDVNRLDLLLTVIASESTEAAPQPSIYDFVTPPVNLAVIDDADALERFGGDEQMFRETLAEFIKGIPARMERLDAALTANQLKDVSLLAHNLKGVSANFGAKRLSLLAYRLDEYCHQEKPDQALKIFQEIGQHLPELNETASKLLTQE